ERRQHDKRRDGVADHVPQDGALAREVVAHPVAVLVGQPAPEDVADVLEGRGPLGPGRLRHVESFPLSRAPAASAAALIRVSTACRCSSSSRSTPSRSITAGGIFSARRRSWMPALVSATSIARSSDADLVRVMYPS